MIEPDDREAAHAVAAAYIDHAPRTKAEVERRLERAGFDAAVIAAVIEEFAKVGLLDDRAFALAWVESRSRSRQLGRVRLEVELRRRGVAREDIEAALATLEGQDEMDRARSLARAFLGSADIHDPKVRKRLAGYLLRRGHAWDTIEQVLLDIESNQDS